MDLLLEEPKLDPGDCLDTKHASVAVLDAEKLRFTKDKPFMG